MVKFTIADGSTDFVAGDTFTIPVVFDVDAKEYRSCDNTNTDGSEVAAAIAISEVDATSAAVDVAAITRDAEVNGNILVYDAALNTAAEKATAQQQLSAAGIIVR